MLAQLRQLLGVAQLLDVGGGRLVTNFGFFLDPWGFEAPEA